MHNAHKRGHISEQIHIYQIKELTQKWGKGLKDLHLNK